MRVVGYVVRRRCIGKNLAFADIQVEDPAADQQNLPPLIQVVFQRDSPEWNQDLDTTFPNKNSKLPYGAKVALEICPGGGRDDRPNQEEAEDCLKPPTFLVRRWELLEHPREKALAEAQSSESDGISCTIYLKSRGEAFLRFNGADSVHKQTKEKAKSKAVTTTTEVSEFSHGDNRAKGLRAKIFASWLVETFGMEFLQSRGGVLDIAGGKGKLSIELALHGKIPCTIIDPMVRKHGAKLESRDAKRILKAGAPHPRLVAKFFNTTTFLEDDDSRQLLGNAQLCVGLHPDECTEDILDVALQCNKPIAIVPCCVFTGFFPLRRVRDAKTGHDVPVQTYEQFLDYLMAKDEKLQKANLPFEGRNVVIYRLPEASS